MLLTILALGASSALAAENTCFVPPSDPTDCSLAATAQTQLDIAADKLRHGIDPATSEPSKADVDCYLVAANYVTRCVPSWTCASFHVTIEKDLGSGWKETHPLTFTGGKGACAYSAAQSGESTAVVSPTGTNVFHTLKSSRTPGSHRKFMLDEKPECKKSSGEKTERDVLASEVGVLLSDWDEDGTVSHHWGRRAEVTPHGDPRLSAVDAATLRLTWPNKGYLDFDADGHLKGSNFLPPSAWDPSQCKTDTDGTHIFPRIELLKDQKFAKLQPGYVKQ